MKKLIYLAILPAFVSILCVSDASAQFNVNWGTSADDGNAGYTDLGTWFKNNGYAADQASGENLAKTGYIGYNAGDADPFAWAAAPSVTFDVVQRQAGNADLTRIGYYTGSGAGKSMTQVLGLNQNGPATASVGGPFGLYFNTPTEWRGTTYVNWFTDRAENAGDPQALIYSLGRNAWLIAWEDLRYAGTSTDRDFNDAYLKLTVTPEPVSMMLFGLGAAMMGLVGTRRRKTIER